MPEITLGKTTVPYLIKYGKRKSSVQLRVLDSGTVEVAAPKKLKQQEIEGLLIKRSDWIVGQLAKVKQLAQNPLNMSVDDGSQILYQGRVLTLSIHTQAAKRAKVLIEGDLLKVFLPAGATSGPDVKAALRKWYIKTASSLLAARTEYWAQEIGVRPQRISIREQKTRWGSASPRGNVNYNWRIIMAPPETLDYLVVHELCHIKVPNHSGDFWLLVSQSAPEYKKHRAWLRQHGALLTRFL